jgi:5S rRNA maturation endonuclease (ribonuclease M5)
VEVSSHVGEIPYDTADRLAHKTRNVLILTDFDREGSAMAGRLSKLLEGEGVVVDRSLRRKIGSIMGILGIKTVESLDDVVEAEARNGELESRCII